MRAKRFKFTKLFICDYKTSHCRWRQQRDSRGGLRNGYMADVADLAVLLVGGVTVPVPGCLHGKQPHRKNQGNG
ncbi:MAG TPA: hypothetical protein VIH97_09445 [Candidatus Acidoferrales bacterium]